MTDSKPTAYVKTNCPYSFKFRLFVLEAGLSDAFTFVALDHFAPTYQAEKAALRETVGRHHTFPVVETAPGEFMDDSDALITHYAREQGIEETSLPTLEFYRHGLYVAIMEMYAILFSPLGWLARLGRKNMAFK